jgi:hypothetical protein
MTSAKPVLYFLLALALGRGLLYASFVPPWQAPDEPPQFERAKAALTTADWNSTAQNGPEWYAELTKSLFAFGFYDYLDTPRLAYTPDDLVNRHIALYQEAYGGLYGSRPMYALIGWPLFLARNQNITLQLYLARLNIVLMNVGIIWLAWLICRAIFPRDNFLAVGVPALILFNPQHTHMLSTVNNGNLAELLAAAALYFLVRGIIRGFSWVNLGLVLLFSAAAVWTKATAYFLPAAIGTVGLFYLWQYRRHWRWFLPALLGLAAAAYLLAPARLKILVRDSWIYWQTQGFVLDPIVPQDLYRSFWAMPGWTIFYLHPLWYQLIGLFCGLALAGLLLAVIIHRQKFFSGQYRPQLQALTVLAVAAFAAIGILLAWNGLTHSIVYRQGRSIYPVIIPLSLFLMLGWRQLIPPAWRQAGLAALVSAFFLFDTLVLFHYIIPFFYSRY